MSNKIPDKILRQSVIIDASNQHLQLMRQILLGSTLSLGHNTVYSLIF